MTKIIILLISLLLSSTGYAQEAYPVTYRVPGKVKTTSSNFPLSISFSANAPWYIYAPTGVNAAQGLIETYIIFQLPKGISKTGKLQLPQSKYKGGYEIYSGNDIKFTQQFSISNDIKPGEYIIKAKVTYQTCNDKICLPPVTDEVNIPVTVLPKESKDKEGISFQKKTWQQILTIAKQKNKMVFVDAYTSWCGPCKWMEKNVFPTPEVGKFFNNHFVNIKFDMEKGEGVALAKKYKVHSFPTYLFIDKNGKILHRFTGSMDAQSFISNASDALDPEKQYASLLSKYEKGNRDPEFVYKLTYMARKAGEDSTANVLKETYLKTQHKLLEHNNAKLIFDFCNSVDDPSFLLLQKHSPEFIAVVGNDKFDKKMCALVYQSALQHASIPQDVKKEDLPPIIKSASEYFHEQLPLHEELLIHNFKINAFLSANDTTGYATEMIDWYDQHPSTDANELNTIAWNFYEVFTDPACLQKALAWALESVKLSEGYANMDTVAALYCKLGDFSQAKLYAEKAIQKGKTEEQDVSSTEKLLMQINQ